MCNLRKCSTYYLEKLFDLLKIQSSLFCLTGWGTFSSGLEQADDVDDEYLLLTVIAHCSS